MPASTVRVLPKVLEPVSVKMPEPISVKLPLPPMLLFTVSGFRELLIHVWLFCKTSGV